MRAWKRLALVTLAVAAMAIGASTLFTPAEAAAGGLGPPGQENCNRPCPRWKNFKNGLRCKFVGCDINGECRYLC